ncbi:hypothetical protein LOZ53_000702 [Ophidiomyces ophidiicola]|uniref:Uncharacterized protein n=1 Tax=Ophidiomyces ophidiicola TaxID=1387563 RepID=A0ACB8V4Y2_9EURO|nr:uncharacterized protein LOZ57_003056 [Ophidiomyces ophidiicola]KAI1908890.1 hypothetical protein LOZ61_005303 [Ophidiomyces ophidiicola]KAI1923700.1 hypothetical protein LOZ64_000959 [Ophidiomyces ophidiicola]KAI1923878.1 hypothetical protein LOZ60_004949 [Ophidiomyces ophidiicola]KAI1947904.1 hypothetical protein LOZ57_003056 [Ophidiomyces ophidiicola]KAI1956048.1 hypothetical protein LOZ62_000040 [Ophidiomyces ophidiicola]
MSFVARVSCTTRVSFTPARSAVIAASRPALFSTTNRHFDKGPIQVTKDTLKKADRVVSDAAVKGIEKGEEAAQKIGETLGHHAKEAKREGMRAAEQGKETAHQAQEKAKEKAVDLEEKAKEEAEELTGKA